MQQQMRAKINRGSDWQEIKASRLPKTIISLINKTWSYAGAVHSVY